LSNTKINRAVLFLQSAFLLLVAIVAKLKNKNKRKSLALSKLAKRGEK
jgi:hypothetical protein